MKQLSEKRVGHFRLYLGLILFIYLFLSSCDTPEEFIQSNEEGRPLPVQIGQVVIKDVVDEVHAFGNIISDTQVTLTSEIKGVVEALPPTTGARMKAGDTVAVIDDREYRLQLERLEAEQARLEKSLEIAMKGQRPEELVRLEADVEANKSSLKFAGTEFERHKNLFSDGVISRLRLDQVENDFLMAKAGLEQSIALYQSGLAARKEDIASARAQLEAVNQQRAQAELNLEKTVVHAPFDSVLLLKKVDIGSYVKSGNELVEIVGTAGLMADFEIPQTLYDELGRVKRIRFHVPELDLKFQKEIKGRNPFRLVPDRDIYSELVHVQIDLDPAPDALFHGLALEASLEFENRKNIKHVPPWALVERENETLVYVVQEEKAQPVKVSVVKKYEDLVEIKDPSRLLNQKTRLVLQGSGVVYPGAQVLITNPPSDNPKQGPPGKPPAGGKKGAA